MEEKKKRKEPFGRPTKYKPEYCDVAIEFLGKGFSLAALAGELGTIPETILEWRKTHGDFSGAVQLGLAKGRRRWEEIGLDGTLGSIKGFNSNSWIFNMRNRFGWKDSIEVDTRKDPIKIEYVPRANKED